MASEELEKSLRSEIDGYVSSRLSGMLEELSRLQSQTNEMFTRFMERFGGDETQHDTPMYAAIAEHLRAAHKRGVEEAAAESARTKSSSEMAILKAAIEDVTQQQTQAGILGALVNRAASFAPRLAFFVVKNNFAIGWRARGLEGSVGDDAIRELSIPLSAKTLLGDAVEMRDTWSGEPGANADDNLLLEKFDGEAPQRMIAVPLVARQKVAAVLYADSAALGPEAINLEAIETLVRVAGLSVELLAAQRPSGAAPSSTATTAAAAAPAPPVAEPKTTKPSAAEVEPVSSSLRVAEQQQPVPPVMTPIVVPPYVAPEKSAAIETTEPVEKTAAPSIAEPPAVVKQPSFEVAPPAETIKETSPLKPPTPAVASKPKVGEIVAEPEVIKPARFESTAPTLDSAVPPTVTAAPAVNGDASVAPAPAAEGVAGAPSAPLGSRKQYGRAEVDLPIEVNESEKRLHIDARRFARLLVSEIKLYNEEKVQKGRGEGDLYDRLREEIDRSRLMYEKRVSPQVAARYDYFHQELINTLAEGSDEKLGNSYPGASVQA